jgi:hypothetical protein
MFALALILATAAYGFAAANTVPGSFAGDGSGTISGYTVSNVHYTLDTTSPARITSVSFTTAPAIAAPGVAKVEITNAGTPSWHSCTVGATVTCDLTVDTGGGATTLTAQGVTNLRVVAAQ